MKMQSIFGCLAGALLAFSGGLSQADSIYHVAPTGADAADGLGWSTALASVTQALAKAVSGDEIWVAAGTYKPTEDADRTASFVLQTGVDLYGGFAGTETARDQRNWSNHVTTLSGDIGVADLASDNCYHVVVGASAARLDGFVIRDGYADGLGAISAGTRINAYGGGLFAYGVNVDAANCTFAHNQAVSTNAQGGGGAGLYWNQAGIAASTVSCYACTFVSNTVFGSATDGYGGGAQLRSTAALDGSITVSACCFSDNRAEGSVGHAAALAL